MGMVLERLILRPMIGEPIISVIMITIALATVLKSFITILLWGTQIKVFNPPIFSQKAVEFGFGAGLGGLSVDLWASPWSSW